MAAVRDGDEADALAAVAFWAREAPRVDRASLATATATLLTALRRPEPALAESGSVSEASFKATTIDVSRVSVECACT